jgi:ribose/xylose/arabinose/galactoside ABC-type transport system permease subunit
VGSVVAFAGTVAASVVVHGLAVSLFGAGLTLIPLLSPLVMVLLGCLAGIMTGIACGCFNGFVITRFRVAPFIATLAVMLVARGLANLYVHGGRVDGVPREFVVIGAGRLPAGAIGGYTVLPPIPVAAIIAFALAGVAHVVLTRTTFGRRVYAIGGSEDVAQLSGIPLGKTKLAIYGLCGGLAGLGGILEASRTWCGDPTAGAYFELDAIAATVVGGASLMGGAGSLGGTVLGALLIGTLNSGLVHKGVSEFYQLVVKGAVILGAVVLDQLTKRRA